MVQPELSPAERLLWDAFPTGAQADLRAPRAARGASGVHGGRRTVRAEVVRALLLDGPRRGTAVPALAVLGAHVTGTLDLRHATVEHAVRLADCSFEQAPLTGGMSARALDLSGCRLPGLDADGIRLDGDLRLTGCRVAGPVRLAGARTAGCLHLDGVRAAHTCLDGASVGDALVLEGSRFTAPQGPGGAGTGTGRVALSAVNARVGGGVNARGISSTGKVLLTGTRVEATLNLEGSRLANPGGDALMAAVMTVGLDLLCNGMQARGHVRLTRSRVGGSLDLREARLAHPGAVALHASGVTVGDVLHADGLRADGQVKLRGAAVTRALVLSGARLSHPAGAAVLGSRASAAELWLDGTVLAAGHLSLRAASFGTIHAAPEVWPERVWFDGLRYEALSPRLPAADRLAVLRRDGDGYVPHAYETLASAYTRVGDEAAARTVRLAKYRHYRSTLPVHARAWGYLQDVTVGYGFRPLRACGWLAALLALGTVVYGLHPPPPLKADEAPHFNPLFYTLDLLLPVVGFGQEAAFDPGGWCQWLSYVLIVVGWVLATTVVTGVTRAVGRQ